MSVKSISDKLKAVALSSAITASLTGAFTAEDAHAQQVANTSQPAASAQASSTQKAKQSQYPEIEKMFIQNMKPQFWHDGLTLAAAISDMVKKTGSMPKALPLLYDTKLPPEAIKLLDAPVSGTAMDIHGFAKYVKHMANDGPPLIKGGNNVPRVILGVVTPADTFNVQPGWRKNMVDVAKQARLIAQEHAKDYGSLVHEIVRVVPSENDQFHSSVRGIDFKLREGEIIVTVGGALHLGVNGGAEKAFLDDALFATDLRDLEVALSHIYTTGLHVHSALGYTKYLNKTIECKQEMARLDIFKYTAEGKQAAAEKAASGKSSSGKSGSAGAAKTEIFPGCEI